MSIKIFCDTLLKLGQPLNLVQVTTDYLGILEIEEILVPELDMVIAQLSTSERNVYLRMFLASRESHLLEELQSFRLCESKRYDPKIDFVQGMDADPISRAILFKQLEALRSIIDGYPVLVTKST